MVVRALVGGAVAAVAVMVGCGGSTGGGSSGAGAGNAPSGTLGAAPFATGSGFAFVGKTGAIDLVLSNKAGICDSARQGKLHAGEAIVQLFSLEGTVPGAFTSSDEKFASVKSTCAAGQAVAVDKSGRATSSTVTITASNATHVQGTLDVTFDDGSKVSGAFDVPTCDSTMPEAVTCQ